MNALTISKSAELATCERTIEVGLQAFYEVGQALANIREKRLYRAEYRTFEDYCRMRWQMSKRHVNRLIGASDVVGNLSSASVSFSGPRGPESNVIDIEVAPSSEKQVRPLTQLEPDEQREAWANAVAEAGGEQPAARQVKVAADEVKAKRDLRPIEPPIEKASPSVFTLPNVITLDYWKQLSADQQRLAVQVPPDSRATFNKQKGTSIEWAQWSWNPVTGCKHNCAYCYARDIANRFYDHKFQPALIPSRLTAPFSVAVPPQAERDTAYRNVFTCSMADLFGRWVPQPWIDAVLDTVHAAPQWNFMFLTKFPIRLSEQDWPTNAIVGASVDTQIRVKSTIKAFKKLKQSSNAAYTWLSLEPLLEPLQFDSLEMFDLIVIGGASRSSQTPEWVPPTSWYEALLWQARQDGCRIYMKDNLNYRPRELPWGSTGHEPERAPGAFFQK